VVHMEARAWSEVLSYSQRDPLEGSKTFNGGWLRGCPLFTSRSLLSADPILDR